MSKKKVKKTPDESQTPSPQSPFTLTGQIVIDDVQQPSTLIGEPPWNGSRQGWPRSSGGHPSRRMSASSAPSVSARSRTGAEHRRRRLHHLGRPSRACLGCSPGARSRVR